MRAAVIVFPGSNCDRDVAVALQRATGQPATMLWHRDTAIPAVDLIVIPGGFSYGDYLRAGAMAAHSPIMAAVRDKAEAGVAVLGICNGFQVLCEAGLLPGALMRNTGLRFVCRHVWLRTERNDTPFTCGYQDQPVVRMPIAHNDGNYFAEPETLARLEGDGRVVFRYCAPDGEITADANPNGSQNNIAGIISEHGTVLGLMPHPERVVDALHGGTDGAALFTALAETLG